MNNALSVMSLDSLNLKDGISCHLKTILCSNMTKCRKQQKSAQSCLRDGKVLAVHM